MLSIPRYRKIEQEYWEGAIKVDLEIAPLVVSVGGDDTDEDFCQ